MVNPILLACVIAGIVVGLFNEVDGIQILSKSKLEKCEKTSDSSGNLNCSTKIVLNLAVPSGSSGGEASIVAEIVEVEDNSSSNMQTVRIPPVITVNKSAAYALYDLTYIRDVPYKPQEYHVTTRKCEPDAGPDIVQICERLRDEKGNVLEQTQPICCPCGPQRRMPSSCGDIFDKMIKGKANTAHCLRFPGDWFHVFSIGQRSLGFSVRVELKTGTRVSEVIIGPENRTATANDNFLKVNLIGDFGGYTSIPSFEDFYLVIPREAAAAGQPGSLGVNYSMWMLLERVRFTLDGLECNKIGVGYEAFNTQPNFCSSPYWSCLHNQLWNFHEADINRISRHQLPLYGLEGRFERINQHPNAGPHSFSIGVTETLNTNLMIELRADDIEYVFQRSPGKIINIAIPTFEALTQFGIAAVTIKNTGEVEASYSLTFDCSKGVAFVEEQFFIIKPKAVTTRSFKLYPTKDQAAKYICTAILKDSQFSEVDRAECQFSTTATVLDNGTQVTNPFQIPETHPKGFFDSIRILWTKIINGLVDFITGDTCRNKCSSFFDFSCHIQYVCLSWMVMFGLLLALFPTTCLLLWLLHQKGLFDPCYDWWEDHFDLDHHRRLLPTRENIANRHHYHHHKHHHGVKPHNHHRRTHQRHKHHHSQDNDVMQTMLERDHSDSHYYHQLHRVHKDSKQKQRRRAKHGIVLPRDVHVERRRRQRLRES
ncbi:Generative cell specific-1/HAP2 domain [Arabidopsis suecica]|uniref:Generative cell specific-1/HAP2 domain n=1 Tax=Arabidopsis suecica TaxID=45249 RepID=A0A8T1ZEP1_ARASU|nr:Generative cell specific-1/HAP2 domain [Arabidopsis suecica]